MIDEDLVRDEIFEETKVDTNKLNMEEKLSANLIFTLIAKCVEIRSKEELEH